MAACVSETATIRRASFIRKHVGKECRLTLDEYALIYDAAQHEGVTTL